MLLVVPWSVFWERNFFLDRVPAVAPVLLNHFVRGAISGTGIVCLAAALVEILSLWNERATATSVPQGTPVDAGQHQG